MSYIPNGKALATGNPDGIVRLWDLVAGIGVIRSQVSFLN
jgi:hypothetical protein